MNRHGALKHTAATMSQSARRGCAKKRMKAASDFERVSAAEPKLAVSTSGSAEEGGTQCLKYCERMLRGEQKTQLFVISSVLRL